MDDMFIRIIVIAVVGVEVFFVMKHGCPDFQNLDGGLTNKYLAGPSGFRQC